MYFPIALCCEVKHALRKEALPKKLPIAHQFEADLVFISSDKASSLLWAVRQFLYHMAYETSVQQGHTAPAGFIILIASQPKLTACHHINWLPHRWKSAIITAHPSITLHGSSHTLSSWGVVMPLLMQTAGQFLQRVYYHLLLLCNL